MRRIAYLALVLLMLMVLFVPTVAAQAKIDVLRFMVLRNPDAQLIAMQTGVVDVLTQRTRPYDIQTLNGAGYTITSTPGFHICFIGFNIRADQSYRRPEITFWPLADARFRHALAHSLDKQEILVGNWVKAPLDSMVPPPYGGWHNPAVDPHPFNLSDPFANTVYPDDHSTCGILRYGGYTFVDADVNGAVTPADYWLMPNGEPLPQMEILSPTWEIDPQKARVVDMWLADCTSIGLVSTAQNDQSGLTQSPREFWSYITDVYELADFDAYIVNFKLNRFPDYLYDWFHSSQDSQMFPGAYNAFGVNDPILDGLLVTLKFSMYHEAKLGACHAAQAWLADPNNLQGLPVLPVYTMSYYDAFNPDLRGIVKSPGFGAGDGGCVALKEPDGPSPSVWTYLNIHWEPGSPNERIEYDNSVVIWCLSEEPERLNPLYAGTTLAWEIMDRVFDPLMAINPYTLGDISWIATGWQVVETPIGMDVTYYLRNDVFWQDGLQYTAWDAEFSLEFIRDNQIPKYRPAWQNIVDVEVIDDFTFTVHADVTSQFLIYDWAALAALLPPQVWANWDGLPLEDILGRDLTAELGWNGETPTNLFGTGPFMFEFYDPVGMYADMHQFIDYFKTTEEIHIQKVEMFHKVGDVNRDGYIDIHDLARAAIAYGCMIGEPCYDEAADLNQDGIIDMRDISLICYFYGEQREYPVPTEDP